MRISNSPINTRGYIFRPDYLIVLDHTLPEKEYTKGIKPATKVLINTEKKQARKNFHNINATKISLNLTGKNIPNVITLGALLRYLKEIKLGHLKKAIEIELKKLPKEMIQKNIQGAEQAFKGVK